MNINYEQTLTDDLEDKTNLSSIIYNQDYQINLNENNRIKSDEIIIPDSLERDVEKQAF